MQQLGTMVIPALEYFYSITVTRCPYQDLFFPAYSNTCYSPERKTAKQKPPSAKSAHAECLLEGEELGSSEPAVLYAVEWKFVRKEAQKAALKNFCFPPSPNCAVHSSDTARS